jgi:hypothetical protein
MSSSAGDASINNCVAAANAAAVAARAAWLAVVAEDTSGQAMFTNATTITSTEINAISNSLEVVRAQLVAVESEVVYATTALENILKAAQSSSIASISGLDAAIMGVQDALLTAKGYAAYTRGVANSVFALDTRLQAKVRTQAGNNTGQNLIEATKEAVDYYGEALGSVDEMGFWSFYAPSQNSRLQVRNSSNATLASAKTNTESIISYISIVATELAREAMAVTGETAVVAELESVATYISEQAGALWITARNLALSTQAVISNYTAAVQGTDINAINLARAELQKLAAGDNLQTAARLMSTANLYNGKVNTLYETRFAMKYSAVQEPLISLANLTATHAAYITAAARAIEAHTLAAQLLNQSIANLPQYILIDAIRTTPVMKQLYNALRLAIEPYIMGSNNNQVGRINTVGPLLLTALGYLVKSTETVSSNAEAGSSYIEGDLQPIIQNAIEVGTFTQAERSSVLAYTSLYNVYAVSTTKSAATIAIAKNWMSLLGLNNYVNSPYATAAVALEPVIDSASLRILANVATMEFAIIAKDVLYLQYQTAIDLFENNSASATAKASAARDAVTQATNNLNSNTALRATSTYGETNLYIQNSLTYSTNMVAIAHTAAYSALALTGTTTTTTARSTTTTTAAPTAGSTTTTTAAPTAGSTTTTTAAPASTTTTTAAPTAGSTTTTTAAPTAGSTTTTTAAPTASALALASNADNLLGSTTPTADLQNLVTSSSLSEAVAVGLLAAATNPTLYSSIQQIVVPGSLNQLTNTDSADLVNRLTALGRISGTVNLPVVLATPTANNIIPSPPISGSYFLGINRSIPNTYTFADSTDTIAVDATGKQYFSGVSSNNTPILLSLGTPYTVTYGTAAPYITVPMTANYLGSLLMTTYLDSGLIQGSEIDNLLNQSAAAAVAAAAAARTAWTTVLAEQVSAATKYANITTATVTDVEDISLSFQLANTQIAAANIAALAASEAETRWGMLGQYALRESLPQLNSKFAIVQDAVISAEAYAAITSTAAQGIHALNYKVIALYFIGTGTSASAINLGQMNDLYPILAIARAGVSTANAGQFQTAAQVSSWSDSIPLLNTPNATLTNDILTATGIANDISTMFVEAVTTVGDSGLPVLLNALQNISSNSESTVTQAIGLVDSSRNVISEYFNIRSLYTSTQWAAANEPAIVNIVAKVHNLSRGGNLHHIKSIATQITISEEQSKVLFTALSSTYGTIISDTDYVLAEDYRVVVGTYAKYIRTAIRTINAVSLYAGGIIRPVGAPGLELVPSIIMTQLIKEIYNDVRVNYLGGTTNAPLNAAADIDDIQVTAMTSMTELAVSITRNSMYFISADGGELYSTKQFVAQATNPLSSTLIPQYLSNLPLILNGINAFVLAITKIETSFENAIAAFANKTSSAGVVALRTAIQNTKLVISANKASSGFAVDAMEVLRLRLETGKEVLANNSAAATANAAAAANLAATMSNILSNNTALNATSSDTKTAEYISQAKTSAIANVAAANEAAQAADTLAKSIP